ncbi:nitrate- and nitrite sensing domain-containing protein [Streptomyces fulvoviolaceus]|uniref:nitrate- and nitrite sensing domain-containing protein n=1 Tax=Streptomyces fulvoviolaceus TaxID=285535 RepID=UPI0004C7C4A9|nr:nitrate- and nitrite sensing domain-containing protein [Streptomyces fulvoviolaceus]
MRRSPLRRQPSAPTGPGRIPLLARLRVGRKLMLLVLLPVTGLLAFTAFSGVAQWQEAQTLRDFHTATRLSFATTDVSDAVAQERIAAVKARLRPGPAALAERSAAERATDRALERATSRAATWTAGSDVAGALDAVSRQLHALRVQTSTGSLTAPQVAQQYGDVEDILLDNVAALESGRPNRASGRAADAHIALLRAIEAAERERAELAVLLEEPAAERPTAVGQWPALETAQLDAFREFTSPELRAELYVIQFQDPGRAVRRVRDMLATSDAASARWPSYARWLADSEARIDSLRGVQGRAARELAVTAAHDRRTAETRAERDLAISLVVLGLVTVLALTLRRSITRPLSEVSEGARALSYGDLSYDIRYAGRDELGGVADTFRELRVTTERLAAEIRSMNTAIDDNHLEHRADVASFEGTWAQLLGGMNGTMASFAAAHGRRKKAEKELQSIFDLSLDLLSISGVDGYFKRVNPAFERTLGYSSDELLSKPYIEFVHEEDRESTGEALATLARGVEVAEFENRYLRADGTERWLQWSARPVPEQGLIYGAARDVTESRRHTLEQAALRRVATLVAHGAPPSEVFTKVAQEVGHLLETTAAVLRHESDGSHTVLGTALGIPADVERATREKRREAASRAIHEVTRTRRAAHVGHAVAAPIVVDDRLWGVIVAASLLGPLPVGTESRLADFTELVATAIANADSRDQLNASRARVVAAADASRRRIERDLHDGVQQRLVALQLDLRLAESLVTDPTSELAQQLAHVAKGLDDSFQDLLQVARGIHPAILSKGGLGPALRSLARRSAVPVELDLRLPATRLPEQLEVAAYYVTSECLTNAVKHAHARVVGVEAEVRDDWLELTIRDDGVGGAEPGRGSGLIGLIDRVEAIGGKLDVSSPPGEGTTMDVRLPLIGP